MPLPRRIARLNRRFTNRLIGPIARYLPHVGVIVHRGRKTGRLYRTPVNVFSRQGGYVIALTYGRGDWVRNVVAAGGCLLETGGRAVRLTDPRLIHDEERRAVPAVLRVVGRLGNVSDFLELSSVHG
jgi:deazaflavin-dependent oxidoreductase (nitroreductase family)